MSARPWILQETTWSEVENQTYDVAILPWGATEPHNYHLPFGTDTYESSTMADRSAGRAWSLGARPIVLPTVPWGVNTGQTDLKLCLNIFPTTQLVLLGDLVDNLARHNIRKLVILNSHGGNQFQPLIRELSVKHPGVFVCALDWWKACDLKAFFVEPGDHAGEWETSVMLNTHPDLVLPLDKAGNGAAKRFAVKGLREGWVWSQRQWTSVTTSTGVGNPQFATAEKGAAFLEATTAKVAEFLVELAAAELDRLYSD
ncbi:MAG: creatininase family protein [Spirochaetales bacterium]